MDTKQIPGGALTLVLGVLIFAFMVFLIYTQGSALSAANQEVSQEKQALVTAQNHLQELKQLKKDHPDAQEELARVSAKIPNDATEDGVIRDIEGYAALSGLNCTELSFGARVPKAGYTEMPCRVVMQGSYQGIVGVLKYIQTGQRVMRIDSIKITSAKDTNILTAEINVAAFCKAGAAPAAAVTPAPAALQ